MILKPNAHQNPSTVKPLTMRLVSIIIAAFITRRNNPKVKNVIGIVSKINIGFNKLFNNESTAATINAVMKPSTFTPCSKYEDIITAKAEIIIFINVFINLFLKS